MPLKATSLQTPSEIGILNRWAANVDRQIELLQAGHNTTVLRMLHKALPVIVDLKQGIVTKQINQDTVGDGTGFVRLAASHASNNVAYNFKGDWSSTVSYVIGDEVRDHGTYWVSLKANTNSEPATSNTNWQQIGINVLTSVDNNGGGSTIIASTPVAGFYFVVFGAAIQSITSGVRTYTLNWTQGGSAMSLSVGSLNAGPSATSTSSPIHADTGTSITITSGGTATGITGEETHSRLLGPF